MKLEKLFRFVKIKNIIGEKNKDVKTITRLSAEVNADTLFFDLPRANGEARSKYSFPEEPLAIVTERPEEMRGLCQTIISVDNARASYSYVFSEFFEIDYSKITVIGITGTNGKTSTATMLKKIFSKAEIPFGFIGTGIIEINGKRTSEERYSMTTPDPEILYPTIAKMIKCGCRTLIMEVSSHSLSLYKTAPIPFDVAIFTGLTEEHMDFYKDMESYYLAKSKLVAAAKHAVINVDDKYGRRLAREFKEKALTVGVVFGSDYYATNLKDLGFLGTEYLLHGKKHITKITLKLAGYHNIYNSLLAICGAISLGIKPCICKEALGELDKIDGRFEITSADVTVIKDYAHTPFALENIIKSANKCKRTGQKTIVVFGCGGERDREKRPMMARIAQNLADRVIITEDNPRNERRCNIISDVVSGMGNSPFSVIADRRLAIEYAIKTAEKNDVIIIAGKGHERYLLDNNGYSYFNEDEIINEALSLRRGR